MIWKKKSQSQEQSNGSRGLQEGTQRSLHLGNRPASHHHRRVGADMPWPRQKQARRGIEPLYPTGTKRMIWNNQRYQRPRRVYPRHCQERLLPSATRQEMANRKPMRKIRTRKILTNSMSMIYRAPILIWTFHLYRKNSRTKPIDYFAICTRPYRSHSGSSRR